MSECLIVTAVMPVRHSSGVHLENHQSREDFSLLILFYKVHSWKFSRFPLPADQRVKINSTDTERRARVCMQPETKCNPSRDSSHLSIRLHPGAASPWPRRSTLNNCTNNKTRAWKQAELTSPVKTDPLNSSSPCCTSRLFFFSLRWMVLLLIHS